MIKKEQIQTIGQYKLIKISLIDNKCSKTAIEQMEDEPFVSDIEKFLSDNPNGSVYAIFEGCDIRGYYGFQIGKDKELKLVEEYFFSDISDDLKACFNEQAFMAAKQSLNLSTKVYKKTSEFNWRGLLIALEGFFAGLALGYTLFPEFEKGLIIGVLLGMNFAGDFMILEDVIEKKLSSTEYLFNPMKETKRKTLLGLLQLVYCGEGLAIGFPISFILFDGKQMIMRILMSALCGGLLGLAFSFARTLKNKYLKEGD